jgi:hypothetical protein
MSLAAGSRLQTAPSPGAEQYTYNFLVPKGKEFENYFHPIFFELHLNVGF